MQRLKVQIINRIHTVPDNCLRSFKLISSFDSSYLSSSSSSSPTSFSIIFYSNTYSASDSIKEYVKLITHIFYHIFRHINLSRLKLFHKQKKRDKILHWQKVALIIFDLIHKLLELINYLEHLLILELS